MGNLQNLREYRFELLGHYARQLQQNNNNINLPVIFLLVSFPEYLDLGGNDISGTLPTELGLMSSLTYMDLGENIFSGAFPTEIAYLTQLQTLIVAVV